jgi:molybdopterin/thiamine biosynthesis adenylyltransferase
MIDYETFVRRNDGYVDVDLQRRIRGTRVLIAGAGVGSAIAETALRIGFERIVLVDHDVVEAHNLNRQSFAAADIGSPKVYALARRLRATFPNAHIEAVDAWVSPENASAVVGRCDFVVDTIDFMSLTGVVALHDAAEAAQRPVISGFTAGWGAAAMFFPAFVDRVCFRSLFGLPRRGSVEGFSYVRTYANVIERLGPHLAPAVRQVLARVLPTMADGQPCPAAQVAVGAASLAALATTAMVRALAGEKVTPAPELMLLDLSRLWAGSGVPLT